MPNGIKLMKREREEDGIISIKDEPGDSEDLCAPLMEYPKSELARMSLEATKQAAMATARAEAAEAEVDKLNSALVGAESKLREYIQYAPDLAMLKYPDEPLKALWEVLNDARLEGPSAAMAIITNPKCGIDRSITVDDNDPFWSHRATGSKTVSTLFCVVFNGRVDVFHAIAENYNTCIGSIVQRENSFLFIASYYGMVKMLEGLIIWGADVNTKIGATERTALRVASQQGKLDCVKLLVTEKALIDVANVDGLHPLHLAAEEGHAAVVEYLVSKGADVKAVCGKGYGPLFYARGGGDEATIKFLDNCGAKLKN